MWEGTAVQQLDHGGVSYHIYMDVVSLGWSVVVRNCNPPSFFLSMSHKTNPGQMRVYPPLDCFRYRSGRSFVAFHIYICMYTLGYLVYRTVTLMGPLFLVAHARHVKNIPYIERIR